jgi:hypothetical protein
MVLLWKMIVVIYVRSTRVDLSTNIDDFKAY